MADVADSTMDEVKPEEAPAPADEVVDVPMEEAPAPLPPKDACETVYVHNLNERIKVDTMKKTLKNLFRQYGKVLDVVAHGSVRMRGQAFIALDSVENAIKAVEEIQGFPLYGKPIELGFAKTPADAIVKRKAGSVEAKEFEEHKASRLERKKVSRRENPLRKKYLAQRAAAKAAAEASGAPVPSGKRIVQAPDEYLPPNKILFVQNLPDSATKETIEALFAPYAGMVEVRTVAIRKGIAFVEFGDEGMSSVARDGLHNSKIEGGEGRLKVTFAKM